MINNIKLTNDMPKQITKTHGKSLDNNTNRHPNEINIYKFENEDNKKNYTEEDLKKAVEETNNLLFRDNDHFEFRIHEKTGTMMVKLVDNETNEVIREMPPEKILDLVANIWELVGILVDERG